MCAVLDGVAAVELELVIDGVKALLCVLVTAVLDPPGRTNTCMAHASHVITTVLCHRIANPIHLL